MQPLLEPLQVVRSRPITRAESKLLSALVEPEVCQLRFAERGRTLENRIEHRLRVRRRAGDDPQDLAGRRLLFERLSGLNMRHLELLPGLHQFRVACLELFPRLRKALLQVADQGVLVLGRFAGDTGLGFLRLRGLWNPAHRPPLASYDSAGDTLGERVSQGKANRNLSLPNGSGNWSPPTAHSSGLLDSRQPSPRGAGCSSSSRTETQGGFIRWGFGSCSPPRF